MPYAQKHTQRCRLLGLPHLLVPYTCQTSAKMSSPRTLSTVTLPADVRLFLEEYRNQEDHLDAKDNLKFYSNELACRPDGLLIEEIHEQWKGDYSELEHNHRFIQWLFPIREHGMNYQSQPLQSHEIAAMTSSPQILGRILTSYSMMLDFYGMQLEDSDTGLLRRTTSYRDRYHHLTGSFHNYLRISRILKSLSEMGLERLNAGFILHVLSEQSEHGLLNSSHLRTSMDRWWINCIRNSEERLWLNLLVTRVRDKDLVFDRSMYEESLTRRRSRGSLSLANVEFDLSPE